MQPIIPYEHCISSHFPTVSLPVSDTGFLPVSVQEATGEQLNRKVMQIRQLYQRLKRPFVLGVSGGIDSAVCTMMLSRAGVPATLLWLGANSSKEALKDARKVVKTAGARLLECDIMPMVQACPEAKDADFLTLANIKARCRMVTQYAAANRVGGLVVGTENRCENYVGYATKFGDVACDVSFLQDWVKSQVCFAARVLNVPHNIIVKAPSADLWEGQTDEGEMNVSYAQLDNYLLNGYLPDWDVLERIEALHRASRHKFIYHTLDTILA